MFWKMSSIGWVIRPITRVLLNARSPKKTKKKTLWDICSRITGGRIGKRQIMYVRDWSVSSDPIISWDVNYTVLGLHVKRQIIEEGKRCATRYLCFHLELLGDCLSFFCSLLFFIRPLSSLSFLSTVHLCWVILQLSELIILLRYCSQLVLWPVLVCVCVCEESCPLSVFTATASQGL